MSGIGSSSTIRSKKPRSNAPGSRLDPAWKYGIDVDAAAKKVECKFCHEIRSGGIFRLKHHLAGTHKDGSPCVQVPDDVRDEMIKLLSSCGASSSKSSKRKSTSLNNEDEDDVAYKGPMDGFCEKSRDESKGKQATLNDRWKRHTRDAVCQTMARWFYSCAIPFNAVKSPYYKQMVKEIGEFGKGFTPPSYHELRETLLKREVADVLQIVDKHKVMWEKFGCTIMSDGWTDQRKRTMVNFLVNSPGGTIFLMSKETTDICKTADKIFEMLDEVVEKVGEDNVVQIVTDNAANYKAAGKLLMEKRKQLFWTPCGAHCLDLMLEDFDKMDPFFKETIAKGKLVVSFIYSSCTLVNWMKEFTKGKELVRPAITRFATSFLTLRRLYELKGELIGLFTSDKWKDSVYAKKQKGIQVCNIIFDGQNFWINVELCLKIASPIIKVLRMVDSDAKPAMGYLYKAIEVAKQEIQKNLRNTKKRSVFYLKLRLVDYCIWFL